MNCTPAPQPVQFKEERGMKIHLMPDLATLLEPVLTTDGHVWGENVSLFSAYFFAARCSLLVSRIHTAVTAEVIGGRAASRQ